MEQREDTAGRRRDPMELGGDLVKQEETTEAAERLFEALEALLGSAQEAVRGAVEAVVQRLLESNAGLSESEKVRLLTSYLTTSGQGETSAAVQSLLTRLHEFVSEALSSVRRLRATVPEEGINPEDQEKCESVEGLLRDLSELSTRGQEALGDYSLTLVQRGDSTGQGGPAETVQRLLTGVTGVLTAAEQCVLTPGAAGCTSEDSPLCTELAGFVTRAQDAVLTFHGETVDERKLPEAARSLLESFADLLKGAASTVRCYSVKEERGGDPWGWDHMSVTGESLLVETEPPDPERRDQEPVPEYQTSIKPLLGDPERRDQASVLQRLLSGSDPPEYQTSIKSPLADPDMWDQEPVLHPLLSGCDPPEYQTSIKPLLGDAEAPVLKKEERASLCEYHPPYTPPPYRMVRSVGAVGIAHRLLVFLGGSGAACRWGWGECSDTGHSVGAVNGSELQAALHMCRHQPSVHRVSAVTQDSQWVRSLGVSYRQRCTCADTSPQCTDPRACLREQSAGRTGHVPGARSRSGPCIAGLLVGTRVLSMESDSNNGECIKPLPSCGDGWIWYHSKCFYFSEIERNWMEAKGSCVALNSSLAMIDTQEELTFILRYKGDYHHWIGLRRDNKTQLWMWVNGTRFNNWFTVRDSSECAYLSYLKAKSLECDFLNKWICTKVIT
ncbi:uncharacterized protein [Pleurodeles waltl]|uniref:uncharacterized protein n=1 Tax=Pleurodeles waltl TaxID=8319 RepID=UPI00370955E2